MSAILSLLLAASVPAAGEVRAVDAAAMESKPYPAGTVSTANPRSIVAALQHAGYRAKLITEAGKRPYIEAAAEGATFYISLENCTDDRDCQDIMFRSSYEKRAEKPVEIDAINAFNRDKRWARAYLDTDGGPVIEYDLLFTDQLVDEKTFSAALSLWTQLLSDFHDTIDW